MLPLVVLAAGPVPASAAPAGGPGPAVIAACPGPRLDFQPLAAGLWWVAGASAEADADNRGHVSHLLLGIDGRRLWVISPGPSAAFGRALNCQVRARFGKGITDTISPWPRPEAVLGQAGLGQARSWAHRDVALAMQQRCPRCIQQLARRLGAAATDLGEGPARIPALRFAGTQGTLGPWRWWRFERAPGVPVTAWQWREDAMVFAPGLLWGEGAPDGRDAEPSTLIAALEGLGRVAGRPTQPGLPPRRWLGEQGPVMTDDAPARHRAYWEALSQQAARSVLQGDAGTEPAPELPALAPMSTGLLHTLNWQRAWRQAEEVSFQRSRR